MTLCRTLRDLLSLRAMAVALALSMITFLTTTHPAYADDDDKPAATQPKAVDKPREQKSEAEKPSPKAVDKPRTKPAEAKQDDDKKVSRDAPVKESPGRSERSDDKSDDDGKKETADKSDDKKDDKKDDETKPSVTHHTATINGKKIAYTATAGKMLMKTDDGDPKAHVFFIAYTLNEKKNNKFSRDAPAERDNDADENDDNDENDEIGDDENDKSNQPNRRPVTFCFNGGPGSSSVWLHLGMLGPTRVKLDSDAKPLPPPHELIPNEYSLLDITDLVFVDPVSTGYSRPVKGEDKRQFHGYDEDLRSVGQFIHDYTTKYGRWASPKFLLGESYGGLRTAGLAGMLQDRYHLYLNGAVLVSAVVDFQTLMAWGHNDVAYVLFLPSYAATAWYHKALPRDMQRKSLEEVVEEAERFAAGPYLRALAAGDSLPKERREAVIEQMSNLTGLSEKYLEGANMRVSMPRFGKELLRERRRVVGRFDSRYTGIDSDNVGDTTEHDPSAAAVFGTFTAGMNDYLRNTLKVEETRVYEILTGQVHPWDYSEFTNRYVDASDPLRRAMTENPFLKVFAACGYYDLATPSFAMKYTRDHLGLAPEVRDRFKMEFYEGGHMMYAHEPSLAKLRKDLLKFYASALKPLKEQQEENRNGE